MLRSDFNAIAGVIGLLVSVQLSPTACAGSAPEDEAPTTVVVTARKLIEISQEVPAQIGVFTKRAIEDGRIEALTDYAALTPSMFFVDVSSAVDSNVSLRGLQGGGPGEPAIGFFVDGIYQGGDAGYLSQELFDLERIEVLRGPQTTLYGKSSTAGAINLITRVADDKPEATFKLDFAEPNRRKYMAAAGGSLGAGGLSGRVAVAVHDFDGIDRNVTNGRALGALNEKVVRANLRWAPKSSFTLSSSLAARNVDQIPYAFRAVRDARDYRGMPSTSNEAGGLEYQTQHGSLRADVELAHFTLSSLTGFNRADQDFLGDLDSSSAPFLTFSRDIEKADASQEIRLAAIQSHWRWTLGGYLFLSREDSRQFINAFSPAGPLVSDSRARRHARTWSVFGDVEFDLSERVKLDVQLRLDRDNRKQRDPAGTREIAFTEPDARLTVSYHPTPDALLYASYAHAHRAGGFNDSAVANYAPEYTDSYETGLKSVWKDRAILNVAAFYTLVDEQQVNELDPLSAAQVIVNRGRGRIYGVETETSLDVWRGLQLTGSAIWMDAVYERFVTTQLGPDGFGVFDLSGNRLAYAPRYSAVVTTQYSYELANWFERVRSATVRLECRFMGPHAWDQFNSAFSEDTRLAGASLHLDGGRWQLRFYVENLFSEDYFTAFVPGYQLPFTAGADIAAIGLERSVGTSLRLEF